MENRQKTVNKMTILYKINKHKMKIKNAGPQPREVDTPDSGGSARPARLQVYRLT